MMDFFPRIPAAFCAASFFLSVLAFSGPARAQSGEVKPDQAATAQSAEAAKNGQKIDELAEAAKTLSGPAGNAECVWLGRRVVSLLWRDDLDTAFRHLDLYDRFGCPASHIQATFRCVVKHGPFDSKAPDSLGTRIHACWLNPGPTDKQEAPAATTANPAR